MVLIDFVADVERGDDRQSRDRIDGTVPVMSVALGPRQKGIHDQTGLLLVHGGIDDSANGVDFEFLLRFLSNGLHHGWFGCWFGK